MQAPIHHSPPQATEATRALLGTLLHFADDLADVRSRIGPADFAAPTDAAIFRAICALADEGLAVSPSAVHARLALVEHGGGTLADTMPAWALAEMGSGADPSAAPALAKAVADASLLRRMGRLHFGLSARAYEPGADALALLEDARVRLDTIAQSLPGAPMLGAREAARLAFDALVAEHEAAKAGGIPGVPTGLDGLDRMLGGWKPGKLYLAAGRPGMGKSAFAKTTGLAAARAGAGVANFTLEMSSEEYTQRYLAEISGVDGHAMQTARLRDADWPKLAAAVATLDTLPIWTHDQPGIRPEDIRARLHRLTAQADIHLVVVDYVQLMQGRGGNRREEIEHVSRELKTIAKTYDVAVLGVCQLSRAVETRGGDKRPILSDLRETGQLEQDADAVLMLWRPEYYNQTHVDDGTVQGFDARGRCEINVVKQRGGPTGNIWARFYGAQTALRGLDDRSLEDLVGDAPF